MMMVSIKEIPQYMYPALRSMSSLANRQIVHDRSARVESSHSRVNYVPKFVSIRYVRRISVMAFNGWYVSNPYQTIMSRRSFSGRRSATRTFTAQQSLLFVGLTCHRHWSCLLLGFNFAQLPWTLSIGANATESFKLTAV